MPSVLPWDYARFDYAVLAELLRLIGSIPDDIEGDAVKLGARLVLTRRWIGALLPAT